VCATYKTGTSFVPITDLFYVLLLILSEYSYGTGKLLLAVFLLIHTIVVIESN
jgi:hypothetical protein